jgi:hypothetical protein
LRKKIYYCNGYGYNLLSLYHHLNLGWSGSDDAWYNLPGIDTSPDYDVLRKCVYNVYPTGSGEIISGRVVIVTMPINGAQVTATLLGSGLAYTATTNAQGIYALPRLPGNSTYLINVNYPGYVFEPQTVSTGTSTDDTTTVGNVWGANVSAFFDGSIPLSQALDNPKLTFNKFGQELWWGENTVWKYGGSAARSGAIGDLQASWIETLVKGPAFVSFYWKVSSEENFDYLRVWVGGNIIDMISGEKDWQLKTVFVPAGSHTVKWEYSKDINLSHGLDCAWVDKVVVTRAPTGALELLLP